MKQQPLRVTPKQYQILTCFAAGLNGDETARKLNIAPSHISNYIRDICQRTGAETKTQLMFWYGKRGAVVEDLRKNNRFHGVTA